jgi:hypothetical protein
LFIYLIGDTDYRTGHITPPRITGENCPIRSGTVAVIPVLLNFVDHYIFLFVFLLVLQLNSGLGRLHETFRFTSVTRSRTVGRTPWTGDQLVARPLPVRKHRKMHTQHKH